jgi:hypothetical protein
MSAFSSKTPKSKGRASNALPVDDLLFEDEEDLAHHHTGSQAPDTESVVSDKELPEARDYVPTEAPCTLLKAKSFQRKRPTISKKPEKESKEAEEEENSESVVLEEELPEDYEPTEEEVLEYAKWLGMDIESERDLFWIAREGLKAPLPENWKPCKTGGEIVLLGILECTDSCSSRFMRRRRQRRSHRKRTRMAQTRTRSRRMNHQPFRNLRAFGRGLLLKRNILKQERPIRGLGLKERRGKGRHWHQAFL